MIKIKIILLLLLLLLVIPSLAASDWVERNIDLTINTRFDEAIALIEQQIAKNSQNYQAYFYLAATLNSKMTHFENQQDEAAFNAAIDSCIRLLETALKDTSGLAPDLRAHMLFYLGSAYGYLAYFQGRSGKYLAALSNGIASNNLLHDAVELDSTLYDAYLGIGVFKYWRYSKLHFISWLPFIPDERDEGIEMIKKSVHAGSLSQFMAMHQLIYILTDYAQADEALIYADQVVRRYPDSQFMWWAAARAYDRSDHFEQAVQAYKRIATLLTMDPKANPNHVVKCQMKLAAIYQRMANYQACFDTCKNLLSMMAELPIDDPDEKKEDILDLIDTCEKEMNIQPN